MQQFGEIPQTVGLTQCNVICTMTIKDSSNANQRFLLDIKVFKTQWY